MEVDGEPTTAQSSKTPTASVLPEVEAYATLLVVMLLIDSKQYAEVLRQTRLFFPAVATKTSSLEIRNWRRQRA